MNRPNTLLSVAHSYVVASNRRLAHEMARLGQGRWQVTAVAPAFFHGGRDLRPAYLEALPDEGCRLVPVPAYLTRWVHLFAYGRGLRSLLRQGWDLVHCWEEPYILAGGQIAFWTPPGTPLVYRTAQSSPKYYPPPFTWFEQYALERAAGWICSGRTVAEALSARRGYAQRPFRLIPLGVDVEAFRPDPAAGWDLRRSLGWDPAGPPVIGFLGRFIPEKGLGLLMRVLDGLPTPWRALFVGAGPLEPALRAWAARYGARVRICTNVQHAAVPRYLNGMDLLCAPSQTTARWREQFGRMVIEGFACGVPVVGSDSGEIPYVLGDAGLILGEKDEAGWQQALGGLLENPSRRHELAERGLERARVLYTWPVVARQHLDFFEEILATRSAHLGDMGQNVPPFPRQVASVAGTRAGTVLTKST
jgi:glycosyltransferase involved in cell wall biosynthesis